MTDQEIIEDRAKKYGEPTTFFEAHGIMCQVLTCYAKSGQGDINHAHLASLKMVLLKVLRSAWNPEGEDNYCDARNYITIAEMCAKDLKNGDK